MSYLYPGCLVATDLALLALWVRCESGAKATRPG